MKKFISILFVAILTIALSVPALAATTKEDIINEMKAGIKIGNTVKKIPDQYIKTAEDFLANNDLTQDQLETAATDLAEVKKIWADTGKTSYSSIPADVRKKLQTMAIASAKKVGATLTIDDRTISIVDKKGKSYKVLATSDPIKQTGTNYTMLFVVTFGAISILGAAAFIAHKNRLFEGR